jgi:4-hydroxybenzoate polyprenyltransferase
MCRDIFVSMAQTSRADAIVAAPGEPGASPLDELHLPEAVARPLAVDLDGTLVRTDTLWESVLLLVRRHPWTILMLPLWLFGGRAAFKRRVAERLILDPAALPYRGELVDALQRAATAGRKLFLSTAADARVANAVAEHLGFFEGVLASDGTQNLKAGHKREALEARFGRRGFDYIGDSSADLVVFEGAERGYLVDASSSVAARGAAPNVRVVSTRKSRAKAAFKALRVHQWSKNALVLLPVVLAPIRPTFAVLEHAALAMVALSLCASAGYVFNDLVDVGADRAHATKRRRPFASGALPLQYGPPLLVLLLGASFGVAFATLPLAFVGMLALYLILTLAYSFYFKSKLLADVILLAWLYTHRVIAGGVATSIPISAWLLAFCMFLFFSLAFAKRYIELRQAAGKQDKIRRRGYYAQDLEMVAPMGTAAGFMAVLVFCLYIESAGAVAYTRPWLLWLICPMLLYWVARIWFLAHRGEMNDDPVKFAITDRRSWLLFAAIGAVAMVARFWP